MEGLKRRVSFADLQRMPDDGHRYELYDGELRVIPSPLPIHEVVKHRIREQLVRYAAVHGGQVFDAPFDIALSEYDVVQPTSSISRLQWRPGFGYASRSASGRTWRSRCSRRLRHGSIEGESASCSRHGLA